MVFLLLVVFISTTNVIDAIAASGAAVAASTSASTSATANAAAAATNATDNDEYLTAFFHVNVRNFFISTTG